MNQKNSLGLNSCFLDIDDPIHLFHEWMEEAKKTEPNDPNAVALAPSNKKNIPSVRMVLLKDFNKDGFVFYKKKKIKFVGNLSMDLSCIDITSIKNPKINDWVEIFGNNISISVFASKCNTITYEVSSKIGSRVKRIYN